MQLGPNRRWLALILVVGLVLAAARTVARADGYISTQETGSSSIMADQKAVIIFRDGHENLVISIGMDLRAQQVPQEMAWIIPVPSRPEVQITDHQLFDTLDQISAPEIVYETKRQGGFRLGVGAEAPPPMVDVLERKQVGVYDVAVLTGQEAGGLLDWLHDEGFRVPDTLQPPLDAYIAEDWTFVAMRIAPDASQSEIQDAQPVWLSFDTQHMVYPMRLTGVHGTPLALRLYILADHRYQLDGFTVEFAGEALVDALDPEMASLLDREYFFTKLFNQAVTPAEMAVDFYPYQAATDEPYREQVVHTYVTTGMGGAGGGLLGLLCPCGLCWLGLALLLAVIVGAILVLRRKKSPSPAA